MNEVNATNSNGANSEWSLSFYITNKTKYRLHVLSSDLPYGNWIVGPTYVNPGTTVEALKIKASGGPVGYEFSCKWGDEENKGAIELYVDVPYSHSNSSHFRTRGIYYCNAWEPIPERGHSFSRHVIISDREQV